MKQNFFKKERTYRILAVTGSVGFIVFYISAAFYYPGGSDFDMQSNHFSFKENYWCELLSNYAKNGKLNSAKPFALFSLFFLNLTLISSWLFISWFRSHKRKLNVPLLSSGLSSTLLINFISGNNHDYFIAFAVILGLTSILQLLLLDWYQSKFLFISGVIGLILILMNCTFYFFDLLLILLPILQKITFAYMLIWFLLNISDRTTYESNK